MQNAALRVAVELGLFVKLSETPHETVSLNQLAGRRASQIIFGVADPYPSNTNTEAAKEDHADPMNPDADPDLIGKEATRSQV